MRRAGTRRSVAYLASMTRLIVVTAAMVALIAARQRLRGRVLQRDAARDDPVFRQPGKPHSAGSGNLRTWRLRLFQRLRGSRAASAELTCTKSFEISSTRRRRRHVSHMEVNDCVLFDTGDRVPTGLCDDGLPSSAGARAGSRAVPRSARAPEAWGGPGPPAREARWR